MGAVVRTAAAEFVGTCLLVAAVVGSGIAATRLSPGDVGLQLLENSVATGAALVALILALGPVSAAFNPVVTLAERALGLISWPAAGAHLVAQFAGGSLGAVLANLMFDRSAISIATHHRASTGHAVGEVVATFGLMVVIFGVNRAGATAGVAYAVGGYITAAYWFTSSTSFANPAVTVSRTLSDTFAGIAPGSVPTFVGAQVLGGALALGFVVLLYPTSSRSGLVAAPPAEDGPRSRAEADGARTARSQAAN